MNTNLFFSNFSGTSGIPRQNPGISRPKVWFPWVSKDMLNILSPTRLPGRPPPHPNISGPKSLGLCSFFLPEILTSVLPLFYLNFTSLLNLFLTLDRANGRGGFGSQTAADPSLATPENRCKAGCGYCDSSSPNADPASTFQLSQCRHCKERLTRPRKGFWVTSGSLSPKTAASIYQRMAKGGGIKGGI